ncbi:hypothetical protein [Photobacterium toruni]|uniref:hypothetical protein n=1 Tax=Photobacterium toruni TaxID=1935446 RepID=UPI00210FFD7E|nr:hypothetical protein [Photobacterium toruni]
MARNYGIGFCKKVLRDLEKIEDQMFEEKGHGFDRFGQEFATELKYKRLLKQFEREKELGLEPSYNPEIHGSASL